MKILLYGATGMVGQGVLHACLTDPLVEQVFAVVRSPTGRNAAKLREIIVSDVADLSSMEGELSGIGACFYCLGISSVGMTEAEYTRVTYDMTMTVANQILPRNPAMTFAFVSGAGTDSTEKGSTMWARVKGRAENALLAMAPGKAYMFRPGFIQALPGAKSKTALYRWLYNVTGFLFPLLRATFPNHVVTAEEIGKAMIAVARDGYSKRILDPADIARLGRSM